ncbi:carbamoyltransferase [candidate division KSB1 bacterium]|nr:carbamoyltransferase [candidate division KSB1 bacterium]
MTVLSFSQEHEAGATLIKDGKILAAINEERLTRVKNQDGFPEKSLKAVFEISGLKPEDVDQVIIPEISKLRDIFFRVIPLFPLTVFSKGKTKFPGFKEAFKHFALSLLIILKSYRRVAWGHYQDNRRLRKMFPRAKFYRLEHHIAHAAAAYFTSGSAKALIISADYWGDFVSTMVCIGENKDIRVVSRSYYPHSLGHYYAKITQWLGFRPNRHEGKIVGLAAFGDPNSPAYNEIKDLLYCDGLTLKAPYMIGRIWHPKAPIFKDNLMTRLMKKYTREDISAVFQRRFEEVFVDLVKNCYAKFKIDTVLLVGGSFANVKLNQRIFEVKGIKNVYIFPNMSDGGISTGAALYYDIRQNGSVGKRLKDVYLGPEFTDAEIETELKKVGVKYEYLPNIERRIAELLAEGHVIARFNGRMEFGPRALGNRSILYPAIDPTVNDWLNKQLKRTEFMPFAPVTLAEFGEKCYRNLKGAEYPAKFMTITFDCTDFMKQNSPATVHVDHTARPQLVTEDENPSYYRILKEYHNITGIPTVVNTSFNMHEEPIVCTPDDAIRSFMMGNLDYLAISKFLVKAENCEVRKPQPQK